MWTFLWYSSSEYIEWNNRLAREICNMIRMGSGNGFGCLECSTRNNNEMGGGGIMGCGYCSWWAFIPGHTLMGGSTTDSCPSSDFFSAINYANYQSLTAAKHLANFCPKLSPSQTIACGIQMASLTVSAPYTASHAIGIGYYLNWDLAMVGENL